MIINIFVLFIGCVLDGITKIDLVMLSMNNNKMISQKRFWVASVIIGLYTLSSYLITSTASKAIFDYLVLIFCCELILRFDKRKISQIAIISFIIWAIMLLVDILFSVIMLYVLKLRLDIINSNVFFKVFMTACICMILTVIYYLFNIQKYTLRIIKNGVSIKNYYIFVILVLSVSLFSISVYICLFNYNIGFILGTLFVMITIYTIAIIMTINEFNQKNRIQSEYDILLKNLNEYENLLDLQRVTNHENKNQLLVIKGMVDKGESNTSEYINSIIDTQYKDNDAIIYKTNRIPSGGLRGLIYYKILTMKEKRINSNLDVDRSLNELDFDNIPIKTNQELCKIVGVFLDNAIQAVSELKKKEIDIYLKYENDELYIKVSNNYSGVIELDKIDNSGYTTKGKGHGYGLSLVKGIIRENDCFKNDREIHGKMFSQIIRLKINED